MNITDFRPSHGQIIIGTATNSLSLGGVTISSNAAATAGWTLVATSSNSAIWRNAIAFGSNSNDVSSLSTGGSSSSNSRADHTHRGVTSLTHSSNTFAGPITLTTPGNTIGITSPSPGTIAFTAAPATGGGAAGSYSGVAWTHGTSMPVGPVDGDRVTRTDLDMDFFYDGTRWLSVQLFVAEWRAWAGATTPSATTDYYCPLAGHVNGDVWLVDAGVNYFGAATTNGTHYTTVAWFINGAVATFNLQTQGANTFASTTIGAVSDDAGRMSAFVRFSKTGTPGNIWVGSFLRYRIIGT